MTSLLMTTYLGHKIEIEPFEWGYVAMVVEPGSSRRLTGANATAFAALEEAFGLVDQALEGRDEAA
jgi:hypothetical protein